MLKEAPQTRLEQLDKKITGAQTFFARLPKTKQKVKARNKQFAQNQSQLEILTGEAWDEKFDEIAAEVSARNIRLAGTENKIKEIAAEAESEKMTTTTAIAPATRRLSQAVTLGVEPLISAAKKRVEEINLEYNLPRRPSPEAQAAARIKALEKMRQKQEEKPEDSAVKDTTTQPRVEVIEIQKSAKPDTKTEELVFDLEKNKDGFYEIPLPDGKIFLLRGEIGTRILYALSKLTQSNKVASVNLLAEFTDIPKTHITPHLTNLNKALQDKYQEQDYYFKIENTASPEDKRTRRNARYKLQRIPKEIPVKDADDTAAPDEKEQKKIAQIQYLVARGSLPSSALDAIGKTVNGKVIAGLPAEEANPPRTLAQSSLQDIPLPVIEYSIPEEEKLTQTEKAIFQTVSSFLLKRYNKGWQEFDYLDLQYQIQDALFQQGAITRPPIRGNEDEFIEVSELQKMFRVAYRKVERAASIPLKWESLEEKDQKAWTRIERYKNYLAEDAQKRNLPDKTITNSKVIDRANKRIYHSYANWTEEKLKKKRGV